MASVRQIIVISQESLYLKRLASSLSSNKKEAFNIYTFTGIDKLDKDLASKVDKILLEASLYEEEEWKAYINKLILLEEDFYVREEVDGFPLRISKYSSLEEMLPLIKGDDCNGEMAFKKKSLRGGAVIEGCLSFLNSSKTRAFIFTKALELSLKGSVLYLELEVFSGLSIFLEDRGKKNMSDLFYLFFQGRKGAAIDKDSFSEALQEASGKYKGFDYLRPLVCPEDLKACTDEDLEAFISLVAEVTSYDYILININPRLINLEVFSNLCDSLEILYSDLEEKALVELTSYLSSSGRKEILSSLKPLLIKEDLEACSNHYFFEKAISEWKAFISKRDASYERA